MQPVTREEIGSHSERDAGAGGGHGRSRPIRRFIFRISIPNCAGELAMNMLRVRFVPDLLVAIDAGVVLGQQDERAPFRSRDGYEEARFGGGDGTIKTPGTKMIHVGLARLRGPARPAPTQPSGFRVPVSPCSNTRPARSMSVSVSKASNRWKANGSVCPSRPIHAAKQQRYGPA